MKNLNDLSNEELKELVELGVITWMDAAKRLVGKELGIELTDREDFDYLRKVYPNLKSYLITDPTVAGSDNLVLYVNFRSSSSAEPVSFCFVNRYTEAVVPPLTDDIHMHLPNVSSLLILSNHLVYLRHFSPFEQLTKKAYQYSVAHRNQLGQGGNFGDLA